MTKDQFISGTTFRVRGFLNYRGGETYYLSSDNKTLIKQIRSAVDGRVVLENYVCNVVKIGKVQFEGFTYVIDKRVKVKYRFDQLVQYNEGD